MAKLEDFRIKNYRERETLMRALMYFKTRRNYNILDSELRDLGALIERVSQTECQPGGCRYCNADYKDEEYYKDEYYNHT